MVKVEMPRASWDTIIFYLEDLAAHGFFQAGVVAKEIADQVYSQEY